uniref:Cyanocobalamin reductase (cyanide-eliminating) n=1 Tax=Hanusia phi TaxID=3032 RepID=A0A7S0ETH5_9CRYP
MTRIRHLEKILASQGLDLLHPFRVGWYDELVEREGLPVKKLSSFGSGYKIGILIGNTKSLWPTFVRALKEDGRLLAEKDPLDTYTQHRVTTALATVYPGIKLECFWSCDYGDRLVAMQRVAELCRAAYLDHTSHLSVHPSYGTWIAWRAVVLLEAIESEFEELEQTPPPPLNCPVSAEELAAAKDAIDNALSLSDQNKLCEELHGESKAETSSSWRHWLRVRETVKLGQDFRYCDDQSEYHYTKNRLVLERAISSLS